MISDPKNLYRNILDAKSTKIAKAPTFGGSFSLFRGEILIIYEKEVEILDQRPKNPYGANLSAESANL